MMMMSRSRFSVLIGCSFARVVSNARDSPRFYLDRNDARLWRKSCDCCFPLEATLARSPRRNSIEEDSSKQLRQLELILINKPRDNHSPSDSLPFL